jgi:hypothetical protein
LSDLRSPLFGLEEDRQRRRNDKQTRNDAYNTRGVEKGSFVDASARSERIPHLINWGALENGRYEGGCVISDYDKCGEVVEGATESNPCCVGCLKQSLIDEEER